MRHIVSNALSQPLPVAKLHAASSKKNGTKSGSDASFTRAHRHVTSRKDAALSKRARKAQRRAQAINAAGEDESSAASSTMLDLLSQSSSSSAATVVLEAMTDDPPEHPPVATGQKAMRNRPSDHTQPNAHAHSGATTTTRAVCLLNSLCAG